MSISVTEPEKMLNSVWNIYYHMPQDKSWDLASYKLIMDNVDSVDKILAITRAISEPIIKYSMLFIMRKGITPMWEDPKNRTGGAFSFKVINKHVPIVWKELMFALTGETLVIDKNYSGSINGITISPKKNFCIIKIWLDTCNVQDPNVLTPISLLSKQGCLFKKHEPEF
jgi:hypothetical protein